MSTNLAQEHALFFTMICDRATSLGLQIFKACGQHHCNVLQTHTSNMGGLQIIVAHIVGHWAPLAKVESALQRLAKKHQAHLLLRRTSEACLGSVKHIPYSIQIVTPDKPGILSELLLFFHHSKVPFEEINASTYLTPRTQYPMASIQMLIHIPEGCSIPALRDRFLSFCEEKNLDAYMEAFKAS